MCFKAVIEDRVEDIKFAKEKLKKSAFSACTLIAILMPLDSSLNTTSIPIDRSLKPIASSIAVSTLPR